MKQKYQHIKQHKTCLTLCSLQLKNLEAFKAYWCFFNYQLPIASSQRKLCIVENESPKMHTNKVKFLINWLQILVLMKFRLHILLHLPLNPTLESWQFAPISHTLKCCKIKYNPPHCGQRVDSIKRAQGNFNVTFHCNFEHGFLHV